MSEASPAALTSSAGKPRRTIPIRAAIHPRATRGRWNSWRWAVAWLTQIVFFGGLWLPWPAGESSEGWRQAILLDIPHDKFYFFNLVLWPQDALVLALALIGAAAALFLTTAIAGRLFCGFACPQTVYTMIFVWIEAKVEGDHLARQQLEAAPYGLRKLLLRGLKHGLWGLFALWTGITFVGYFSPIHELLPRLVGFQPGPWEGFWVLFYGAFTYVQAGLAREAVCQHMCPYSRFQGVMVDAATRTVGYDLRRGEPRGKSGSRGDCVDCSICVQVCPTGIDIRHGQQYQCINCGLCADACNAVMRKIGKPLGLIRLDTAPALGQQPDAPAPQWRRLRISAYAGLLLTSVAVGLWWLDARPLLRVDVLRDRGSLVREAEGWVENSYTLRLLNLAEEERELAVSVSSEALPAVAIRSEQRFRVAPGSTRPVQVTVGLRAEALADDAPRSARPITFHIATQPDGPTVREASTFFLPR
jgi:cytochrome c oxidase accessory protein FixG